MVATCFALTCFTAALLVGYSSGHAASTVILRATMAMVMCWFVGRAVGAIAQTALDHQLEIYRKEHPLPLLVDRSSEDTGDVTIEPGEAAQV